MKERKKPGMGTLYVVGTPIGNLEDVSFRVLETLRQVSLIAAEDTRQTRKLLSRYDIATPLTSYYEHNKLVKIGYLISALGERDVALVSEAGMPGISDPGYELIKAAIAASITVTPIPGPSAAVTALAVSGLPTDQFTFVGFLPRQRSERHSRLRSLAEEPRTLVAYEAPHRLCDSLADIGEILGNRAMCAARELTKLHEEILRGSVDEMAAHFASTPPRGEFTLVIAGATREERQLTDEELLGRLENLLEVGISGKEAVERVAKDTGHPKKHVYSLLIGLKKRRS
jgi:16S rRNA (cytidine1402-2'-O)-methyltransferase